MPDRSHFLSVGERLDDLHWVLSYHVGHLGLMATEMDRLSLPQTATDFRAAAEGWDRVLQEIEDARRPGTPASGRVVRGPGLTPERPSPAPSTEVLHVARQRRQAAQGPGRSV